MPILDHAITTYIEANCCALSLNVSYARICSTFSIYSVPTRRKRLLVLAEHRSPFLGNTASRYPTISLLLLLYLLMSHQASGKTTTLELCSGDCYWASSLGAPHLPSGPRRCPASGHSTANSRRSTGWTSLTCLRTRCFQGRHRATSTVMVIQMTIRGVIFTRSGRKLVRVFSSHLFWRQQSL